MRYPDVARTISLSLIAAPAAFLAVLLFGGSYTIEITPEPPRAQFEAIEAIVTAYTASPDETDDTPGIMASGKEVYDGAAACPRRIELGTKIVIDGQEYTCEDRMHIRFDDRFDILMESKEEARAWGKAHKMVLIAVDLSPSPFTGYPQ